MDYNNGQYNQGPYTQPMQGQQPMSPQGMPYPGTPMPPQDYAYYQHMQHMQQMKKKNDAANILCIISCVVFLIGLIVLPNFNTVIDNGYISISLETVFYVAALVLMIIARVTCPQNTFAKILMWIYIILTVGLVLFSVLLVLLLQELVATCAYH